MDECISRLQILHGKKIGHGWHWMSIRVSLDKTNTDQNIHDFQIYTPNRNSRNWLYAQSWLIGQLEHYDNTNILVKGKLGVINNRNIYFLIIFLFIFIFIMPEGRIYGIACLFIFIPMLLLSRSIELFLVSKSRKRDLLEGIKQQLTEQTALSGISRLLE